jgi:sulfoxide reductase catalytic subunit YedY
VRWRKKGAAIGIGIIAAIVLVHVMANLVSANFQRATHETLAAIVDPVRDGLLHRLPSVQDDPESMISPYFRANGYPPISAHPRAKGDDETYERLMADGFADYRLQVRGLVDHRRELSLDELRAMPRQEQTTLHHCIQGWTSIGRGEACGSSNCWMGAACGPRPGTWSSSRSPGTRRPASPTTNASA